MKYTIRFSLIAFLAVLLFSGNVGWAKDCEFDFYYQAIEKVEQINNPEPQGWWEKTKAFVKGVGNRVARAWNENVTQNFFPSQGSKLWYSKTDPNLAYRVKRVKVRDEAHLLELMGVKNGDLSKLSEGQKALLAVYQHSKSEAIKSRMQYSFRSNVNVILTDTTGFDDEKKYPHLEKDFWANSTGFTISMNSHGYSYPGSDADAKSTFVHEFAHTLDMTFREFKDSYGPDGSHYSNEKTKKRSAFLEGFAEFNEMLDSSSELSYMKRNIKNIKVEGEEGKYTTYAANGPELSGMDLTEVEGINAMIMYRLSQELPDGKAKVFVSFKNTNVPWRSLKNFLKDLVKTNPEQAAAIGKILNEETYGKLSDAEMTEFLGSSSEVKAFLAAGRGKEAAAVTTGTEKSSGTTTPVKVLTNGSDPFGQ